MEFNIHQYDLCCFIFFFEIEQIKEEFTSHYENKLSHLYEDNRNLASENKQYIEALNQMKNWQQHANERIEIREIQNQALLKRLDQREQQTKDISRFRTLLKYMACRNFLNGARLKWALRNSYTGMQKIKKMLDQQYDTYNMYIPGDVSITNDYITIENQSELEHWCKISRKILKTPHPQFHAISTHMNDAIAILYICLVEGIRRENEWRNLCHSFFARNQNLISDTMKQSEVIQSLIKERNEYYKVLSTKLLEWETFQSEYLSYAKLHNLPSMNRLSLNIYIKEPISYDLPSMGVIQTNLEVNNLLFTTVPKLHKFMKERNEKLEKEKEAKRIEKEKQKEMEREKERLRDIEREKERRAMGIKTPYKKQNKSLIHFVKTKSNWNYEYNKYGKYGSYYNAKYDEDSDTSDEEFIEAKKQRKPTTLDILTENAYPNFILTPLPKLFQEKQINQNSNENNNNNNNNNNNPDLLPNSSTTEFPRIPSALPSRTSSPMVSKSSSSTLLLPSIHHSNNASNNNSPKVSPNSTPKHSKSNSSTIEASNSSTIEASSIPPSPSQRISNPSTFSFSPRPSTAPTFSSPSVDVNLPLINENDLISPVAKPGTVNIYELPHIPKSITAVPTMLRRFQPKSREFFERRNELLRLTIKQQSAIGVLTNQNQKLIEKNKRLKHLVYALQDKYQLEYDIAQSMDMEVEESEKKEQEQKRKLEEDEIEVEIEEENQNNQQQQNNNNNNDHNSPSIPSSSHHSRNGSEQREINITELTNDDEDNLSVSEIDEQMETEQQQQFINSPNQKPIHNDQNNSSSPSASTSAANDYDYDGDFPLLDEQELQEQLRISPISTDNNHNHHNNPPSSSSIPARPQSARGNRPNHHARQHSGPIPPLPIHQTQLADSSSEQQVALAPPQSTRNKYNPNNDNSHYYREEEEKQADTQYSEHQSAPPRPSSSSKHSNANYIVKDQSDSQLLLYEANQNQYSSPTKMARSSRPSTASPQSTTIISTSLYPTQYSPTPPALYSSNIIKSRFARLAARDYSVYDDNGNGDLNSSLYVYKRPGLDGGIKIYKILPKSALPSTAIEQKLKGARDFDSPGALNATVNEANSTPIRINQNAIPVLPSSASSFDHRPSSAYSVQSNQSNYSTSNPSQPSIQSFQSNNLNTSIFSDDPIHIENEQSLNELNFSLLSSHTQSPIPSAGSTNTVRIRPSSSHHSRTASSSGSSRYNQYISKDQTLQFLSRIRHDYRKNNIGTGHTSNARVSRVYKPNPIPGSVRTSYRPATAYNRRSTAQQRIISYNRGYAYTHKAYTAGEKRGQKILLSNIVTNTNNHQL